MSVSVLCSKKVVNEFKVSFLEIDMYYFFELNGITKNYANKIDTEMFKIAQEIERNISKLNKDNPEFDAESNIKAGIKIAVDDLLANKTIRDHAKRWMIGDLTSKKWINEAFGESAVWIYCDELSNYIFDNRISF